MIYCPGCGTANREGSRFCNECGARIRSDDSVVCPRCGVTNVPGAGHCQECGLDLARARDEGAPDAEEDQAGAERDAGLPPWLDIVESDRAPARAGLDELSELEAERFEARPRPEGWSPEAIPIEPIVGVPYRAYARTELPPTAEQERAAALFASVVAEDVHAAPCDLPEPRKPAGLGLTPRRLLAAALLVVLLVAALWPGGLFAAAPAASAPVAAAAAAVERLPAGAPVLVVFDYDAAVAGDLQPVAEAYLRHLLRRGLRVLLVSTQPEGAALAGMALERALPGLPEAQEGPPALNLGYVAGGEAAVRALAMSVPDAAPAADGAALQGIGGARDLPLIVVLARDLTALRCWIEQVGTPYDTPLVAGVPTQVGLALEPYRAAGQLQGLIAGVGDAAAYERLGPGAATAGRLLGGLRLGAWLVTAAVGVANLWAFVAWLCGRGAERKRS